MMMSFAGVHINAYNNDRAAATVDYAENVLTCSSINAFI